MKTNLKFFTHRTDAHRHTKFLVLRQSYNSVAEGWVAYGRFWALAELIADCENCILDLNLRRNVAAISAQLGMTINDFLEFVNLLKSDDIELLQEVEPGKFTAGKLQEALEVANGERQRGLEKYSKRKNSDSKKMPQNETSAEKAEFSAENLEISTENLYKRNETKLKRNLNLNITPPNTSVDSSREGKPPTANYSGGGGEEKSVSFQKPSLPADDNQLHDILGIAIRENLEIEPKRGDYTTLTNLIRKPGQYLSQEHVYEIVLESLGIAGMNRRGFGYAIQVARNMCSNKADEIKKIQQQQAKQVIRQENQLAELYQQQEIEESKAQQEQRFEELKAFFELNSHLFSGNDAQNITDAIAKRGYLRLETLVGPVYEEQEAENNRPF